MDTADTHTSTAGAASPPATTAPMHPLGAAAAASAAGKGGGIAASVAVPPDSDALGRSPLHSHSDAAPLSPCPLDSPRALDGAEKGALAAEARAGGGSATPATSRDSDSISLEDEALVFLDGEREEEEEEENEDLGEGRYRLRLSASLIGTESTASSSSSCGWSEDGEADEKREEEAGRRLAAARLRLARKKQQHWAQDGGKQGPDAIGGLRPPSCLPFISTLRPKPRAAPHQHVKLGLDRVRPYLERHGINGMAYGHLHKAQYHFEVPGLGLVSYCWVRSLLGRAAFVTTDPLAAPGADTIELLRRFHATVGGMKHYCGVSQATADALKALGYTATVFGNDYQADYAHWKAPKGRRRYLNEGTRAGLVVEELRHADLTQAERERVKEISALWLGAKTGFGEELQMLTYPFYEQDEWEVRKFYCFDKPRSQGGQMLAYIFFTPCFRDGRVVGHNANILRRDPTLEKNRSWVLDFLLLHCERRLRGDGAEFLSLSFSPLHGLAPAEGDSRFLRRTFQRWYHLPSRLYAKKTLGAHKDHFHMSRVGKVYVCAKGTRSHVAVLDLILTVTNLLPVAKRRHGIES